MHFENKDELHGLNLLEVTDSEKCGYLNARKVLFSDTLPEFQSQRVHGYQTLLNSPWQHFYPKFQLIQDTLNWKTSLLFRSQILGLFGNTFPADHMYSHHCLTEIS